MKVSDLKVSDLKESEMEESDLKVLGDIVVVGMEGTGLWYLQFD